MGIKGKLADGLKSFAELAIAWIRMPKHMVNPAIIFDSPNRLYRMRFHNRRIVTGLEAFVAWYTPIKNGIAKGFRRIVIVMDDRERVPSQKGQEWAKRSASRGLARARSTASAAAASATRPYSDGSVFVDAGIIEKDATQPALLDLDRLSASPWLFSAFMTFVAKLMETAPFPEGVRVYLDYQSSGPEVYTNGAHSKLETMRHPFGEADMAVWLWASYFRVDSDVVIASEDSDVFLIGLNYVATSTRFSAPGACRLLLQRPKAQLIDLVALRNAIGEHLYELTIAAILTGTDFFQSQYKQAVLPRTGNDAIIEWAIRGRFTIPRGSSRDLSDLLAEQTNVWDGIFANPEFFSSSSSPQAPSPPERKAVAVPVTVAAASPPVSYLPSVTPGGIFSDGFPDALWTDDEPESKAIPAPVREKTPTTYGSGGMAFIRAIESIRFFYLTLKKKKPKSATATVYDPMILARLAWNIQYWCPAWDAILITAPMTQN